MHWPPFTSPGHSVVKDERARQSPTISASPCSGPIDRRRTERSTLDQIRGRATQGDATQSSVEAQSASEPQRTSIVTGAWTATRDRAAALLTAPVLKRGLSRRLVFT